MDERSWSSAHLYLGPPAEAAGVYGAPGDRVILETVAPFLRERAAAGWTDRFFFIRFTDAHGPHVRLRLRGSAGFLADAGRALEAAVRRAPEAEGASRPELRWVDYEPEYDRYGGPEGVAVSEEVFHAASRAAVALLDGGPPARGRRLGMALLALVVLAHAFHDGRANAAAFCRRYADGFRRGLARAADAEARMGTAFEAGFERQAEPLAAHVREAWRRLAAGDPLPTALEDYRASLRAIPDRLRTLARDGRLAAAEGAVPIESLAASYAHLMHNRLGVARTEEAYLAHLAARCLERTGG
jgi:lantibiotic biosynthesis protein